MDTEPGVTGAGRWIWIELGRGGGACVGGVCGSDLGRVMDGRRRRRAKSSRNEIYRIHISIFPG